MKTYVEFWGRPGFKERLSQEPINCHMYTKLFRSREILLPPYLINLFWHDNRAFSPQGPSNNKYAKQNANLSIHRGEENCAKKEWKRDKKKKTYEKELISKKNEKPDTGFRSGSDPRFSGFWIFRGLDCFCQIVRSTASE